MPALWRAQQQHLLMVALPELHRSGREIGSHERDVPRQIPDAYYGRLYNQDSRHFRAEFKEGLIHQTAESLSRNSDRCSPFSEQGLLSDRAL